MHAPACYREFAPHPALHEHVRAFFTFSVPSAPVGRVRSAVREVWFREARHAASPLFADGHASIVFSFGSGYRIEGLWPGGASGHAIGAMSQARVTSLGEVLIQVGAYLRAARIRETTSVAACELTDRIVSLNDVWRGCGAIEEALHEAPDDGDRVSILESALLQRLGRAPSAGIDAAGLAAHVLAHSGSLSVEQLACDAGVSRQHLTRVFREEVGITPKLFSRLARFRAALARVNEQNHDWAGIAAHLGYADQSHLIADFKQFSGLTPASMAAERRFHPFTA